MTYSGNTTGKPTWTRPLTGTPPTGLSSEVLSYEAYQFSVDVSGTYTFSSVNSWDDLNFLYQGSFNPATPLANVLLGQDPWTGSNLSNNNPFTQSLTAGTNYFLVKTGFNPGDAGAYSNTIDGAGNITGSLVSSTAVPEPFSIIGTLIGGTAAMRMRKKLAKTNQE